MGATQEPTDAGSTKTLKRTWQARRLAPADLDRVAALMAEAYGADHRTADPAFLRFQYFENPLGPALGWVAESPTGEIVGAYSVIPWPLAVGGEPKRGMLSLNTATSPRYQKLGIFVDLARRTYADAAETGAVGVIGFPNQHSRHGLVERLGWSQVGQMEAWVKPRRIGALALSWLERRGWERNAGGGGASLSGRLLDLPSRAWFALGARRGEATSIDASVAALLPSSDCPLRLDYRPDWAAWRFGPNPRFRYECVHSSDRSAVVICRHDRLWGVPTTLLLDFGGDTGAPLSDAIRRSCDRAASSDTAQTMTLVNPGHPAVPSLRRAGFMRVPHRVLPHAAFACYLPLGGHPVPERFSRWQITVAAYDAG